jgi:hypothetical protein
MNGIALSPEVVLLNSRTSKMDRTKNNIYLGTPPRAFGQTMADVHLFLISIF